MANRMNKVRALTGGMAAIMIMSNVATVTAYAAEPETVAAEQTVEITQEAPVAEEPTTEETAPAAEEPTAEETAPAAEEPTIPVVVEAVPSNIIIDQPVIPDDVKAAEQSSITQDTDARLDITPIVEEDPIDPTLAAIANETETEKTAAIGQALETEILMAETREVEYQTAVIQEADYQFAEDSTTGEEIGTAKAGYFEETPETTETTNANTNTNASTNTANVPGNADEETLQKKAEQQANRILRETTDAHIMRTDSEGSMTGSLYFEQMTDGNVYVTLTDYETGEKAVIDIIPTEVLISYGYDYDLSRDYVIKTQKEQAEALKEKYLKDVAAEENLKKISKMNVFELQEFWNKISTVNTELANGTYVPGEDETEEEKNIRETLETLGIDVLKETIVNSIDKSVDLIPGADFAGAPLKDLIKKTMGLSDEKPDVIQAISEQTKTLENKLDDIFKKLKEGSLNAVTVGAYGTTLNNWETSMNNANDAAKRIDNNENYNDVQKLVRYASIIGGENDWNKADNKLITQLKQAAQVLIGGSQVDPKERSLYDLAYDYEKDESLFAGEAMQKCENYLKVRTTRFIATCNVFLEYLEIHKQVADLTQEQVDAMDADTRKMYDNIKSSKESINTLIDEVMGCIFRGFGDEKKMTAEEKKDLQQNGKGVLAVATEYYNRDKTVYIDTGNKNIDMKDKLTVRKPSEYVEYGYKSETKSIMGNPVIETDNADWIAQKVWNHVNNDFNNSGLTTADINKIRDQARKNGMTIKEYLAYSGFDVSNLGDGILVRCPYKNNHAAGASGYHVGNTEKFSGSGHDCKSQDKRMVDWFKVFDKNARNIWIGREDNSADWYYFFEME
ncbi:hypothetical protein [Butyrivibrio sp. NC2007]|uniref:hypothetical protein n=1 Tax=Butyrivibrio sp. NC2007 TaxID=1280683 RepID=UPI0003B40ADB|nr:hypothetical protein [Butyrivibrio sp. NC2007]